MGARVLLSKLSVVGAAVAISCGILSASAQAAPAGSFSCFTAPVIVTGGGQSSIPLYAPSLSGNPCKNASGNETADKANGAPGSAAFVQGVVSTQNVLHSTPVDGDHASASTSAQHVVIQATGTVVEADVLGSQASVTCTAGSPVISGSSSVSSVSVNGTPVTLTGGEQDVTTPAGTLHINDVVSPNSAVSFYRALWLETSSGDIIAGESAVAYNATPCQVSTSSGGGGGTGGTGGGSTQQFGCRGISVQYGTTEPVVANPKLIPCLTSDQSELNLGAGTGFLATGGVYADTLAVLPNPLTFPVPTNDGVLAKAGAGSFDIGMGPEEIKFDSAKSQSIAFCSNSKLTFTNTSTVQNLFIGGQSKGDFSSPSVITLQTGTLYLNWQQFSLVNGSPWGLETRALWWHPLSGTDMIVGDSHVGVVQPTNPC